MKFQNSKIFLTIEWFNGLLKVNGDTNAGALLAARINFPSDIRDPPAFQTRSNCSINLRQASKRWLTTLTRNEPSYKKKFSMIFHVFFSSQIKF